MLLQPKKSKHKKIQRGNIKKHKRQKYRTCLGNYYLKAAQSGLLSSKQLESTRQSLTRKIKKKGKVWLKVFPQLPITKKPNETRMGKGKGVVQYWVARVNGGSILFELIGIPHKLAKSAFKTGSSKLPIITRLITVIKR